ncbi:hypothetical protein N7467_000447 [Penicillium canescens]|nr:hypothetical protein N7467_000447 [Penicillium canescens]
MVNSTEPIIIIGAGVFGLSTAYELSSREYKNITVLDRFLPPVPDGSSVDISRIIRMEYADPVYHQMAQEAMQGWKTSFKDYYHHSGFAILSETSSNPYIEKILQIIEAQGGSLDASPNANSLKKMYPDIRADYSALNAYHNSDGGWADAEGSIRHLANLCKINGVSFITGKRGTVQTLQKEGGRVNGVNVLSGEFLPASQVILATGAWSNLLLDMSYAASASGQPVGFIQLTPEEASNLQRIPVMINLTSGIFAFPPQPGTNILKVARHSYGFGTAIKSDDGGRIVSSPKRDSNNANQSFLPEEADQALRDGLRQLLPEFANHPWSILRLCWYTDTPEGDFIIDHHPALKGLFLATGGAGHAFKFLPVLGRYIADCFEHRASAALRQKWRLRLPDSKTEVKIGDGSRAGPAFRILSPEEQSKL